MALHSWLMREFHRGAAVRIGPATDNLVPAALDRAREKMIFISPNHRYYPLIADLVSAVGKAWQQGYEQGQRGRKHPNPYAWSRPNE